MMLVFGSVRIGLIGLIPNVTPALVVGGLMGWLHPLDMMTATIMLMILGLAVDDTPFTSSTTVIWSSTAKAIIGMPFSARSAPSGHLIVLTSVVICANFAIYTTSESLSFIHMGILSVAGIASALLADLCVTPILFKKFRLFGKETNTDKTRIE